MGDDLEGVAHSDLDKKPLLYRISSEHSPRLNALLCYWQHLPCPLGLA